MSRALRITVLTAVVCTVGIGGFGYGQNQPETDSSDGQPNFTTDPVMILSDTLGYDFGPYMNDLIDKVRTNWYSLIPASARLGEQQGRVVLGFTIADTGQTESLSVVTTTGSEPLDRAAAAAIQVSNPFAELPPDFDGNELVLQFSFRYNNPD